MRTIAFCSLILTIVFSIDARTGAQAAWCAQYFNGGTNCGFSTMLQCQESVRGVGGQCGQFGSEGSAEQPKRDASPRREPKQKAIDTTRRPRPAPEREVVETPRPVAPQLAGETASQETGNSLAAGRALIRSGKYEAAIAALRALGYDDHPDVAVSIGYANIKLGRLEEGKFWYEKALVTDPNHLPTLSYYGVLGVELGDMDAVRAILEKIKSLCGNADCWEYQDVASALAAGLPQRAPERQAAEPPRPAAPQTAAEPAPQESGDSLAAVRALIRSGKYEAAIAALRALGDDDNPEVAVRIGYASLKLGRLAEAKFWYERGLATDPNHLPTLAYYVLLRAQQGDLDTARASLEKIKALCGGAECREYQDVASAMAALQR